MRRGRFAGLSDGSNAGAPLSSAELLLGDLLAPNDHHEERMGGERVRSLSASAIFLFVSHLVCGGAMLLGSQATSFSDFLPILVPLIGVLALDVAFFLLTRSKGKVQHHSVIRLCCLHVLVSAALWSLTVDPALASAASEHAPAVRVAVAAGFVLAVPAFLSVPIILVGNAVMAVGAVTILFPDPLLIGAVAAASLCLIWFSLVRLREAIDYANGRFAAEWEAQKARRFVDQFEQSGHGWFWETTADGALSYVSEQLAEDFDKPTSELLGVNFATLLMVEEGDSSEHSLSFHLSARFPFSDVTVRANTAKDVSWSLSGTPNFDAYGRFLGFRGIGTDLTEKRRSEAEISRLARFDSLTGLPNRPQMRQMLDEALRNAADRKRGCSLFLIDLDRFKNVNDTLGHPAGDELLRQVAARLTSVLGDQGQIGRLGGDEFKAVLPGLDDEGSLAVLADRLIQQVSAPYTIHGHSVSIGASVGIAIARASSSSADALIRDADLALYAAKDAGRGTHRFFAPAMHLQATDRQILEADLRNAVAREEMKLLFQPLFNSVTEEVVGFEALLRWEHPSRGTIMPLDFIPLAEECGLMTGIGAWVLRTACAEAAKWPEQLSVAVNLSPTQFASTTLPALILNTLAATGIDPVRLELEVTEAVFAAEPAVTEERFDRLKALGVRLVLDDFGTGYSSLGYLQQAPLDKIKIDRSFLHGSATVGSRKGAIVRAIVGMAESLGMEVTAEGAETVEELELIRKLGCSQVQGYIFGRPMPVADALELACKAKPVEQGRSRPPRHGLLRLATLHASGNALPVRLRNISAGGALLECDRTLDADEQVKLDLPGYGVLDAEVRWSQSGNLGIQFGEAFDLKALAPSKKRRSAAVLKPEYLTTEDDPKSPWAARQDKLKANEVRRF